jgi:hypothetical protein
LLHVLLAHGLVRRVRTTDVIVHPIGGDNFNVTLGGRCKLPTVALVCRQGTEESRQQELYKVRGGASKRGSGSRGRCGGGAVRC